MKNKSLKVRLLTNLMLFLSFAWIVTLGIGYILAQRTLNEQLDTQLAQIANSLSEVVTTSQTLIEIKKNGAIVSGENKSVEFQIWHNDKMIGYSIDAPAQSLSQNEGYSQNEIANRRWRVFSTRKGNSRIIVGQDLDVRKSLVRDMILSNLWPMIVALPIIALIVWLSVTSGLMPLSTLATAIKKRSANQLTPIDLGDVPSEVTPVIQSLNDLLGVVSKAFEREKQFSDNAAHELRTPLAAIKTQSQVALRSKNEQEIKESILAVNQGVDRASKMVTQLLTLARLDPENLQILFSIIDFNLLVSQAIAKFVPLALAKNIDIGLSENEPVQVEGNAGYLETLVSNLIDNAIRYSPQNGIIDIKIHKQEDSVVLTIEDNGPGIPEKDRERVFDRFVRLSGNESEGSGIGLAIVKKIITIHNAKIELDSPKEHSGLIVCVTLKRSL